MAQELKLGFKASAEQFDPRELVEIAVAAEEHGMDSVAVSDHFQPWRHNGGHAPFSLAWMAAVGERTKRVQIGTSVMTPTFRYNPAVIAQAFASMGCMYPGRIMLGVGTGEALNEYAAGFQGEWPEFKERFARLREAIRLMRELWTGDEVNFDGEYYHTQGAYMYDVPEQPIPVYVAAGGPVVARYAGRAGDGFICTSGKGADLYQEKLIPAVKEGAEKAERDFEAIDRMIEIKISYDPDPQLALENTRFWAPLSLTPEQKHSVNSSTEMERLADELPIEQVAKRWIVASDPDEAVEKVKFYTDCGLNHLVFHAPGHDQRRFLENFEKDLAPRLRKLSV
ncbi:glucose-6-phosphate dehydrogenase, F420- dependent [Gordonia bronchialis DSM 43247]|uniref:F420-dependent glucose-6-phosphate dehydrogenase n=1 Tax=Gordonia bronchialis (strain ATCC 25592 / DSM 43247 / BCRC 13721 / JCM 3198 / KCTC 3076 / NBRC 16047 / NCTC 10667) TaxID=526226 RepID=FGD_GORB4|nr:glucose-6-phosphate dehydrogenase (coenzyme-F420) [Gordonia bronchialis]D0L658.1 RecName: Full=F420-dependent glucose-6-phosphate dehydrogenase; Short=FGD; Short=G6PD [Gordonia bronchialis DSM 43247]ACY23544.1 glucose-6-phosphate dehydrogenase, F420- dependent [Gordonia bronchialis DSM 43247]MCC3321709.1 glucose-6-phosphate dehydrogenase (coenzyme-F420) [Gordonia bronchialis]QGS23105.1 glucose-6-phosphate dehydrogenase (coenzyme-F420) [Gordonia bronchialis]STQ66546.1 F420-dependent glucose-